jgi:SAM-dependent methyltransferase
MTGMVNPMPNQDALAKFYDGFLYSANIHHMPIVARSSVQLFSALNLDKDSHLQMLDVGGGGGFYSKSFEDLGYGGSTYIDLDQQACDFAKNELKVSTVINADVTAFDFDTKFDFIMCRHIVEHLVSPGHFILKIKELLSEKGVLLVMCPNGASLEYLAYPAALRNRFRIIQISNKISVPQLIVRLILGDMLHGIDPPRHLWAITRKGMSLFLQKNSIKFKIYTKNLADQCYSPYFIPQTFLDRVSVFFADKLFSRIHGGTHLVLEIRK